MTKKSPYQIVKYQYVTEKSMMLQQLKTAESNRSVKRCDSPKYVFIVERTANKAEIADAVEEIYKNENVKVMAVNTINVKAKPRRVRGRAGFKNAFKKAIVTLRAGDSLDNV
ncbi:MAG: 50S ribosomal protein L23 [Candidatus Protochlamydia sp.]|nr:50S ribosomal protein L23 [Candidatus Protochlamydia sp.]